MAKKVVKRNVVKVEEKPVKGFVTKPKSAFEEEKPVSVLEEKREFKPGDSFVISDDLKTVMDTIRQNRITADVAFRQATMMVQLVQETFGKIMVSEYPELSEFNYVLNHDTMILTILSRK